MANIVEQLELASFAQEDHISELPPPDIVAFNELRSCADLYRMHKDNILTIQPGYQREIVWKPQDQTRFIDSLMKQLPIPSMCFSLDPKTQQWQVIDGLQRMWTIIQFLSGKDWTLSQLDDVDPRISGQPVGKFIDKNSDLHSLYVRLENLSLPVTIIRCDYSKKSHQDYIVEIFHRLNSGGTRLNNQEIRNCVYSGTFNALLKELNADERWMSLNKMNQPKGYRFITEEIILRFFCFHDKYVKYNGHLGKFLDDYMSEHRDSDSLFLNTKRVLFNRTVDIVHKSIFDSKRPRKLRTTVLEAILVGVSLNLNFLEKQPPIAIKTMYQKLYSEEEFSDKKLREGIAGKDRVIARMNTAKRLFAGL